MSEKRSETRSRQPTELGPGYVHVYTGDGKGKTTAAVGMAMRAAGAGLRVFLGQFIKSERYGEIDALERFEERIVTRRFGRGCWLEGEPEEEDVRRARKGLEEVRRAMTSGEYALVILDEACLTTHFGLLPVEDLLRLIDEKPPGVELVFTGRRAHALLIERADLVTEMREVKHYYQRGVQARRGIES